MSDTNLDTDILIIGAGPVGLFLANECARRGLRSKIIEARASQSQHSKALAVMPRTLEIFDMAGIAGPFLAAANRVTSIAITAPSRTLTRTRFAPENTLYPFVAMVPQDVTERILVDELRRKGGDVDYQTTFASAVQRDNHVVVTLDRNGECRDWRVAFVVGCDGAHSPVRHLLNLPFQGQAYDASFMLADIETNEALPADEMQLCPSESGPLAVFPMSSTRRRLVATVATAEADQPTLEIVRRALSQRGPRDMQARSIHWSSYFRIHHRQVTQMRVGRMFVAGDAAHIHSPIGGQGMNTGLHDAWNLVWKLDLALRGRASPVLMDSYDAERTPVVRSVIEMTHLMTRALGTPSKLAQSTRNFVVPLLLQVPPFRHTMVQRLSQLGVSYSGSPIVKHGGTRYFDQSLRGGHGICSKFLLLLGSAAAASDRKAAQELVAEMSDVVELRPSPDKETKLVRPDGYIACDATRGGHSISAMRSLLHTMTAQPISDPH